MPSMLYPVSVIKDSWLMHVDDPHRTSIEHNDVSCSVRLMSSAAGKLLHDINTFNANGSSWINVIRTRGASPLVEWLHGNTGQSSEIHVHICMCNMSIAEI